MYRYESERWDSSEEREPSWRWWLDRGEWGRAAAVLDLGETIDLPDPNERVWLAAALQARGLTLEPAEGRWVVGDGAPEGP